MGGSPRSSLPSRSVASPPDARAGIGVPPAWARNLLGSAHAPDGSGDRPGAPVAPTADMEEGDEDTMNVATKTLVVLAALGLLAAGPAMAQSAGDQPASGTAGGMTQAQEAPRAQDVRDEELREYARVQRQLDDSQELQRALRSGDFSGQEQSLSTALAAAGSSLTTEEFQRIHRAVQSDSSLQARVQEMGGTSQSGAQDQQQVRPGEGAPLPSGALGVGPSTVTGGTPPETQRPSLGAGAPAVSDGGSDTSGQSGAGAVGGGASGGGTQ